MLSALDPKPDLEAFDRRVEALNTPIIGSVDSTDRETSLESHHWWVPIAGPESAMAGPMIWQRCQLGEQLREASLWWTRGSNLIRPCLFVCRGLSAAAAFPAKLAGDWSERNWQITLAGEASSEPAADEENLNS